MAVSQFQQTKGFQNGITQFWLCRTQQHFFPNRVGEKLVIHILQDHKTVLYAVFLPFWGDAAADGFQQTAEGLGKGAFPNTVMAHQAHDFSFAYGKIFDFVDRTLLAIAYGQILSGDQRLPICRFDSAFFNCLLMVGCDIQRTQAHFLQHFHRERLEFRCRPLSSKYSILKEAESISNIREPSQTMLRNNDGGALRLFLYDHIVELPDGPVV